MSDNPLFAQLRTMMADHRGDAIVTTDTDDHYALARPDSRGKLIFLAAVQAKRSYVAVHLFPVYEEPALLDDLSDALRKRMQGKSCFNFKVGDPALFEELSALIAKALSR